MTTLICHDIPMGNRHHHLHFPWRNTISQRNKCMAPIYQVSQRNNWIHKVPGPIAVMFPFYLTHSLSPYLAHSSDFKALHNQALLQMTRYLPNLFRVLISLLAKWEGIGGWKRKSERSYFAYPVNTLVTFIPVPPHLSNGHHLGCLSWLRWFLQSSNRESI